VENYGQRVELIKKIQKKTDSILISLIYNTSNTRFRTQLASDILDSLNLLLKSIPNNLKRKKISLFLHSQGGFLDVVTSFVYMLRKKFETFDVIIPEIAHSAATILSLGADNILMSYYSSLSPFDPQLSLKTQSGTIGASTEDIKGYYSLMLEFFKDDMAKVQAFNMLANRFPPEVLGNMERVQKQVRMVATKMLGYHNTPEEEIEAVIDKFQKEFYSHQYRIHFDDAKKLGLKVSLMDDRLESLCIELLALYKSNFGTQADLEIEIPEEKNSVEIVINRSYLESLYSSFSYKTKYRIFKDKKVEVEELGWLSNEFIKSTKEKSDEN
jgi:ATP-dependent protease ClpP protease subunit